MIEFFGWLLVFLLVAPLALGVIAVVVYLLAIVLGIIVGGILSLLTK